MRLFHVTNIVILTLLHDDPNSILQPPLLMTVICWVNRRPVHTSAI